MDGGFRPHFIDKLVAREKTAHLGQEAKLVALEELTAEEWFELYEHLLAQLDEKGFSEVRQEIQTAAAAPVFEERSDDDEGTLPKRRSGAVGNVTIRRRRPEEAFDVALDLLEAKLVEIPMIAAALVERLQIPAMRVEFRVDYEQRYAPSQAEPVRLDALLTDQEEIQKMRSSLDSMRRHNGVAGESLWQR